MDNFAKKQRATVQAAIDSGVLNNTNRSHELVDFVAKLAADKGLTFDFANNEKLKETGFAMEGVTVNGFVNNNGVTVNIQSAKALNAVVGHEITHVLEGTQLYDALAQSITEYAKAKGEYQSRYDSLAKLYAGVENANVEAEVVADLVGDYLFTDKAFVQKLSTENRNVFQKIFDEVKYLCKVVTAGSKEAKQLLEVKKAFEEAYRAETKNPTGEGGTRYSLNQFEDGKRFVDVQMDASIFDGMTVAEMNRTAKAILMEKFAGKVIGIDNRAFVNGDSVNEYLHPSKSIEADIRKAKLTAAGELDNLLDAGEALPNEPDGKDGHIHPDAIDFSYYKTVFKVGNEYFEGIVNIKNIKRGKLFKDVTKIRNITKDIVSSYGQNPKSNFLRDASMDSIRNSDGVVNSKFSLSEADKAYTDAVSRGDTETAQKLVDQAAAEAGYTIKAYHGTSNEFTTFQQGNKRTRGSLNFGNGFYFSPSRSFAQNYTTTGRVIDGYLKLEKPYEVYGTRFDRSDLERIAKESGEDVTIDNVTEVLQQLGYDGIIAKDYNGTTNPVNQYVIFDAAQVKSAEAVTYDDKGKVIPLSERFNPEKTDIRYSLSEEAQADDIAPLPWQVRGRDVALEDFAPIGENVVTKQNTIAEDELAPVREDAVATPREYISLEDYANNESPVWRNVGYADEETKTTITQETHDRMVSSGAVVTVAEDVMGEVEKSFPDLRSMKKTERTPILKEAINKLKNNIRQFLTGLSNQNFEFEVNGKVLEAKLYSTGINEVLEKVTQDKANMLYSTEEIFRNAQYLYSTPDYDGDPNVYRWNYFYTPVQIGEEIVGVRIAVRDVVKGVGMTPESQIYNWGIKKDASLDGGRRGPRVASSGVSSDASNSNIPHIPPNVNPDDSTGAAPSPNMSYSLCFWYAILTESPPQEKTPVAG